VKLGLECGYDGHPGHRLLEGFDGCKVDGVVGGRGRQKLPKRGNGICVHHEGAAISRAGVHRFQCDAIDPGGARRNLRDRLAVIGHTLHAALCQHRLRRHFQDLILERSRSQVRYE
jgi:hypothetical protein